ncbi:cyclic peptide export ABC transporter [Tumebacillus sp. ITR2]|uniref:Cyclic peptide export ABC transporter n=1 Tax=Tumebacillus amylolyticus TaxID=2801339 RepID=A0ABS1JEG5_9BACL|nr:cyclic peptide export ABC transporter [Tumebacillus amylolyticus]MBL0388671.1 cyclic peptide export ABC transporter [Tumebacillus amylolyticus]
MRKKRFIGWTALVLSLLLLPLSTAAEAQGLHSFDEAAVQAFIEDEQGASKIPGLAVVIVEGDKTIYQKGFGYANTSDKRPVTEKTLFELGSNSKAFTALAVLQLESEGKLHLSDPVTKYLPWFAMKGKGNSDEITVGDLLHHTSGIPAKSLGELPVSQGDRAIEETVRAILPLELKWEPGTKFEYATVNYDVLGLIIERVTGQPFQAYSQEHVLHALGLTSTYAGRESVPTDQLALGYKRNFLHASPYEAPYFEGNTPAGYFISDAEDMAQWLKIQLGTATPPMLSSDLIRKSHEPDRSVAPDADGSSYADGWSIYQSGGGEVVHQGQNPNFSSYLAFRPGEEIGVAVLANQNSDYTSHIGDGILKLMLGKEIKPLVSDTTKKMDQIASAVLLLLVLGLLSLIALVGRQVLQVARRARTFRFPRGKSWVRLLTAPAMLGLFYEALYQLPDLLYGGMPWTFIKVWGPETLWLAVQGAALLGTVYAVYAVLNVLFPKPDDRSLLSLVLLSVISGFGNAFLIFVINETFVRTDNLKNGLLFFFLLGIVMYVLTQRFIRARIVTYANELVYSKRMELIDKLLKTPYYKLESVEKGRIEATLNNDTEVISRSLNLMVTSGTSTVTLLFCFLYLGLMNVYAFLISLVIIGITVGLYTLVGQQVDKVYNETRDIQNKFFRLIQDLTRGAKELSLHRKKSEGFRDTMDETCGEYRDKRTLGDVKFANVFVLGELLFVIVIGVVAFVFPEIFTNLPKDTIHNYVLVFLYMTGPVNDLLNGFPQLVVVRISWQRIQEMLKSISDLQGMQQAAATAEPVEAPVLLKLSGVSYTYKHGEGHTFGVGPIHYEFRSGEIVFITGGNGSGKSTLSKLITGLYAPDEGEIRLNGRVVTPEELTQNYSAILSDFHLFDRLYGIDAEAKANEIKHYLDLLQLSDKVQVEQGRFSTTKLSTGQKKRLALLLSYLEDRPILLFDEWAADQDPEYRRFFYQDLLPQMRDSGKCIIAITHDDHYFDLADHILAMDMGQIRNQSPEEVRT